VKHPPCFGHILVFLLLQLVVAFTDNKQFCFPRSPTLLHTLPNATQCRQQIVIKEASSKNLLATRATTTCAPSNMAKNECIINHHRWSALSDCRPPIKDDTNKMFNQSAIHQSTPT
jgi:hypothetical protein